MFNKELFNKICNVSCSFEELEEFVIGIDKKEFDTDNPFDKYYGVDKILSAIEKYQAKEVDAKFIADWMNAYDWIIMGGFKNEERGKKIPLKTFLIWQISEWLDSLAFFDDSDDFYNLEDYKNTFSVLDFVLQDIDDCEAVCAAHHDDENDCQDCGIVLITNDNSKYFIKIYTNLNFDTVELDFEKVEFNDLENKAKLLSSLGYRELIYYTFNDED